MGVVVNYYWAEFLIQSLVMLITVIRLFCNCRGLQGDEKKVHVRETWLPIQTSSKYLNAVVETLSTGCRVFVRGSLRTVKVGSAEDEVQKFGAIVRAGKSFYFGGGGKKLNYRLAKM